MPPPTVCRILNIFCIFPGAQLRSQAIDNMQSCTTASRLDAVTGHTDSTTEAPSVSLFTVFGWCTSL